MRRLLSTLLKMLLLIALILVGVLGWLYFQQRELTASSSELALTVTEEVLSTASNAALLREGHPSLQAETMQGYLELVPERLGALQAIVSIQGGLLSSPLSLPLAYALGNPIDASYQIGLQFSEEDTTLLIDMAYLDGRWQLTEFFIDSSLMDD